MSGNRDRIGIVAAVAAVALAAAGCGGDDDAAAPGQEDRSTRTAAVDNEPATTTVPVATEPAPTDGYADPAGGTKPTLPGPVRKTRNAILAAAARRGYDGLRPLIDADTFLSDFGFGQEADPAGRWETLGTGPIETMEALLQMDYVVRETNEGTLFQWPSYGPDSRPGDITDADREQFLTFMTAEQVDVLVSPDAGYAAPRLGILADGAWWFFVLQPGA